jgi:hypothetical protein
MSRAIPSMCQPKVIKWSAEPGQPSIRRQAILQHGETLACKSAASEKSIYLFEWYD